MLKRLARIGRWLAGFLLVSLLVFGWWARPMLIAPGGDDLATVAPPQARVSKAERASVLLVGDTHFGESYHARTSDGSEPLARGYDYVLEGVRPLAGTADLLILNLETPLTHRTDSPLRWMKRWVHWGNPDQSAEAMRQLGVSAASLANNHAFDQLAAGLDDTVVALTSRGIAAFGAGRNLEQAARPYTAELAVGKHRVHLVVLSAFERTWNDWLTGAYATSTGAGTYPLAARTLTSQIRAIKRADSASFLVVFPHWGSNYGWRSSAQSALGRAMLDAGADIVIGQGAHLLQEIEPYHGRLIVYGLGNFVFLSPGRYRERGLHPYSMAVRLDFTEQGTKLLLSTAFYFLDSDNLTTDYHPHVVGGADFERAERVLLTGGKLSRPLPGEFRRRIRRERDAVGEYLRLELGTVATR
jgi:poly-gamma-glutamate capsule biosynthesis protein CapA/YwtB (metallophosphatase superfamily)